jgi:hypothetical protein
MKGLLAVALSKRIMALGGPASLPVNTQRWLRKVLPRKLSKSLRNPKLIGPCKLIYPSRIHHFHLFEMATNLALGNWVIVKRDPVQMYGTLTWRVECLALSTYGAETNMTDLPSALNRWLARSREFSGPWPSASRKLDQMS